MSAGLTELVKGLATDTKGFIREYVAEALAPLEAKLAAMDASPATIAARTSPGATKPPKGTFERELAQSVHWAITKMTTPLEARIAELQARIQALEARPVLRDAGAWEPAAAYLEGDIVSKGGSAWICRTAHVAASEFDHTAFRLLVKKGRDGRDAR